ncbi:hypothetical protein V2J09_014447 [Rumex salicifolius]
MAYQGGTMKSTSINGVKMYTMVGQQRSLATWINPKKRRALRKDKEYMERVDVLQELKFETATTRIKPTPDGNYLIASGIYPPQIKVYELKQTALKFERHLISEIIDFQILDNDYEKLAFLCADRSVCLHAKPGSYYSLRIPRMGRDMEYDPWSCDLLCAASSPDLYRINLQQGRFLSPLSTRSPALNIVSRSKLHGLVACGGDDGAVECFDMRVKSSVGRINAVMPAGSGDQEVTAIAFDEDAGFQMAVGSSEGKVLIYDLRSSSPIQVKDHMYGSRILDIKWHRTLNTEQTKIISTDKHVVRIWDPNTGEGMTSIEPTGGSINDICVFPDSGLMLLALDSSMIPSYLIPSLGPAPQWCSYLENLTEELEESSQATIYEDYKFLTKEELEKLNMTHLVGTNLLRAYMHGYFVNYRIYKKAKSIADPVSYDTYLEQRKREELEKTFANQITLKKKLPKVNRKLASRLLGEEEDAEKERNGADVVDKKENKKKKRINPEMFKDPSCFHVWLIPCINLFMLVTPTCLLGGIQAYNIDEESEEYLARHRNQPQKKGVLIDEEHFEPVMEDIDESDEASSDSESGEDGGVARKKPRLFEVKDERHADAFFKGASLAREDALPLGERVAALRDNHHHQGSRLGRGVKVGPGGSREISFTARSSGRRNKDDYNDDDEEERRGKRRGVQSLGFKGGPPSGGFRGGGSRGRGGRGGGSRGRGGRGRGGRGRGRG